MAEIIACFLDVVFDEHITKVTINDEEYTTSPIQSVNFNTSGTAIKLYFADGYEYNKTVIDFEPQNEEYTYPTQSWDASTQTLTIKGYSDGTGTATITSKVPATKQTIDVSTLTGWANLSTGNHQITVKTKASGYADSAASNAVTVSKAATPHSVSVATYEDDGGQSYEYSTDDGATWNSITAEGQIVASATQIKFRVTGLNSRAEASIRSELLDMHLSFSAPGDTVGTWYVSDNYTLTQNIDDILCQTGI